METIAGEDEITFAVAVADMFEFTVDFAVIVTMPSDGRGEEEGPE